MKVIIFGSTGTIGQHLVQQSLSQGHTVTAFVRNPGKIQLKHSNLKFVQGDVMDLKSVSRAVKGQDIVFCALGAGRKGVIRSEGTKHIIEAMKEEGVRRLICQTSLGVGESEGNLNFFWKHIMFGMLLKEAFKDHQLQEEYIKKSDLDWTIVRPAAFTDGKLTGEYLHGFPPTEKKLTLKISRADVADFMLKQLSGGNYLRKAVGLSY